MNRREDRIKTHKDADNYINRLRDGAPERKSEARDALIRTGVLTNSGKKKETIVSWE